MLRFSWCRWLGTKFTRRATRRARTQPAVEQLEDRTVLSFTSPIISDHSVTGYLAQEATGDFNGDGKVDIAVLSYLFLDDPIKLTVLQGNGDGTFQAQTTITLLSGFDYTGLNLAVGDVNGDATDDLVMMNGPYQMKVFYGSANSLTAGNVATTNLTQLLPSGIPIPGGEIVLGHFTRTDRLDAAILQQFGKTMRLMVNQGNGTFVEQLDTLDGINGQDVNFNVGIQYYDESNQILVTDLNDDGIDDAIVTFGGLGNFGSHVEGVLTIKSTGGADGFIVSAVAANALGQDLQGGDLDGDGLLDLGVNKLDGTGGIKLLKGQADGSFQAFASSPFIHGSADTPVDSFAFGQLVPGAPIDFVFNLTDGVPDAGHGGNAAYVFAIAAGQGNAAFGTPDLIYRHQNGGAESLIGIAGTVLVADVDGDGVQDLINVSRSFFGDKARTSVLLNAGGTQTSISFPDIEEGSPITIVANVTKSRPEVADEPSGVVIFKEGDTVLGQAMLLGGVATSDLLFLSAGQHTIHAVYAGDGDFFSSAAPAAQINVIVNPGRTKTTVEFPNLIEGQTLGKADVTKYFETTAGIPSGTVAFKVGNTIVGEGTLIGGQLVAELDLGAGSHSIVAVYSGDGTFTPSSSKPILINVQPAPLPDLGLLHVTADGNALHFNRENDHFEADGVIHIGLKGEPFQSLLDLNGTVSIGDGKIVGNGTVTAHVGNFTAVLFEGEFEFDIGNAHANEFHAPALPTSLKIGGLDIDFNQLELVNGGINLGGRLHLPDLFGDKFLDFNVGAGIHIDANGISSHFGGGGIGFPAVEFPLAGLGITASDLNVDYDANQDRLKIQGKLGLPNLFGGFLTGVQVDLAGDNFLQIKQGEVDLVGDLIVKRIDIVPNVWTLKDVKLHVNTLTNAFEGEAKLFFPGGFGVSADIGLINGQLDTIQLGVHGLNVPVPLLPGAFLKSIEGGVTGLTTDHPTFTGDLGFTYLPSVSFDLPAILGGQHFNISIVSLDIAAQVNNQHISAEGAVQLLKGVTGTAQNNGSPSSVDFDWVKRTLTLATEMHLINNIVEMEIRLKAGASGNVSFKADASINLPEIDTGLLNIRIKPVTLLGAHAEFQFVKNSIGTDDYFKLYGTANLPILGTRTFGVKLYFNGNVEFIGLKDPIGRTFNIPAGSDIYMFTTAWENDVGNVPFELIDPNGVTYTEEDFDNVNMGVIDLFSGATSKSIGLKNPIPGNWTVNIPNEVGLGEVVFHGYFEVDPPTLTINSTVAGSNSVTVNYDAQSVESTATVAWYYDDDNSGFDGTLISAEIANALGNGQTFNWDTTGIAAGTYYIYGKVDDGINPSVFVYAPASVTIGNNAPVLDTILDEQVSEGQTLTLFANATDFNGDLITYSLGEGAPAGMDIDPTTGEITWTPTEAQGPDTFQITVIATDNATPALSGSTTFEITVFEQNATPAMGKLFAQSRAQGGTFSFTATATDADSPAQTLQFSLDGAPDGASINPTTGAFTWAVPSNLTPDVYPITIRVTDNGDSPLSTTATVNLTVTPGANLVAPGTLEFDPTSYSVDEGGNATITVKRTGNTNDVVVVQYLATGLTATAGQDFTATAGFLVFEEGDTTKTFVVPALFDSSTEGQETVKLTLSDIIGNAEFGAQNEATLTIENVASVPPVFTSSATFNVAENQTAVGTVTATDSDIPPQTVTFSITGGADAAKFNLTSGGVLTFATAPDFDDPADADENNVYLLRVTADDGNGGATVQNISVTVTAVNDNAPIFTSTETFEVAEGQTAVTTVTATDADTPADTVTLSITGGADAARFNIASGVLTFATPPDFETPTDNGTNNTYSVQVTANDGQGHTTVQTITVTVTAVNDNAPVFTSSATFSAPENSTAAGTVVAPDADLPADTVTYAITGGADQAAFAITTGGALSFLTAPDFEAPTDSDTNNTYQVQVTANDGAGHTTVQNITVTVTNVAEAGAPPELALNGSAVIWTNKEPAVPVFGQLTVGGNTNFSGGTLTLTINAVGTAKKLFDVINRPSFTAFGTAGTPTFVGNLLTLTIQLNANATDTAIQTFLRGITFSTKGKGFKQPTRTVQATLTDAFNQSSSVTQTITVRKKAPKD